MAGVTVTFVTGGILTSGHVANAVVQSDSSGRATCGQWTVSSTEGINWLYASLIGPFGNPLGSAIVFNALVLAPDPPGTRYDLLSRGGGITDVGSGYMVLRNDGSYRRVALWGWNTSGAYAAVNQGAYTRADTVLTFGDGGGYVWADGVLNGDVLTFQYDDYFDIGFHSIVFEVYGRSP